MNNYHFNAIFQTNIICFNAFFQANEPNPILLGAFLSFRELMSYLKIPKKDLPNCEQVLTLYESI